MKKVNMKVLMFVEHAMRNEAVSGLGGFPSACAGMWHQPKIPINQKKK